MSERIKTDICIIGAGSGGLAVAAGAAQIGADTVLIEKGLMGGDCLNYGCVPSKALLAAAHTAQSWRDAGAFGMRNSGEPEIDFAAVNDHVRGVIGAIAPHDSVERFEGLGVRVIQAAARFTGPTSVEAGGLRIDARRIVVATGSSALVPPVPGLDAVPFLTNETIFDLRDRPEHLIIMGGGPIGMEMAQAHRRLGCRVTVVEMFKALGRDDPDLAAIVLGRVRDEGVEILEETKVVSVATDDRGVAVTVERDGETRQVTGSHLLVAAGRRANVDGLGLEAAGIAYSPKGIDVDRRLRTSNRKVFAIGDVAGGYQFTHVAGYHAGIVIRNALFRLPAKTDYRAVPWVTYTDPELAQVGKTEAEAKGEDSSAKVVSWSFAGNDRAQAERRTEGLAKVITDRRGVVIGASIAGLHAGELLQPWILAIQRRLKIGAMAGIIAPYPTLGEVNKRLAGEYYTPSLFSPRVRRIVRLLSRFG